MDYETELGRRITQFHRHLEPMDRRAHEVAQGTCFLIFENRRLDGGFGKQANLPRTPPFESLTSLFAYICARGFRKFAHTIPHCPTPKAIVRALLLPDT